MWANKKNSLGFTIVETLIVLAVSAAIFVSTTVLVSGQIAKQQYRSGINQANTIVRDLVNDVQTGYYPEVTGAITATCGGVSYVVNTSGFSDNCILVGKRITFDTDNLIVDTLVDAKNAVGPSGSTATISALQETIRYPNQMTLVGAAGQEVNTVYASYPGTVGAKFGSLSIAQKRNAFAAINNASPLKVCLTDGVREGSITFGLNNSLQPQLLAEDDTC